ncbi:hypothetical protein [Lactococcus taiwanensis]|uniref:hypothetical protein n=1 Tax=Lactococcus taiwanensis TaxID=1151742 RepID=UPI00289AD00B|nr:hypothetical protein [Lactococcus taiwanensis]
MIQVEDTKYDDLVYCHQLLSALEQLEQNKNTRAKLKEKFQKQMQVKSRLFAWGSVCFVPLFTLLLLSLSLLKSSFGKTQFLILSGGALLYLLDLLWWKYRGKKRLALHKEIMFRTERSKIDQFSQRLTTSEPLANPRLPQQYLTPEMVRQIIAYLNKRHAGFLEEAIYMMELDLRHTKYNKDALPIEQVLQSENEDLQKKQGKQEKKLDKI